MTRRGFTVIEVLVTVAVLIVGVLVLSTTFSMSLRQSTSTRERTYALLLVQSLLEEIRAHPYGTPAPPTWAGSEKEYLVVLEGRTVETRFQYSVTSSQDQGGNGSFFDSNSSAVGDVLKIKVTWTEATGVGSSGNDQKLEVYTNVWRQDAIPQQ